jgi:FG-GAP-like repeat
MKQWIPLKIVMVTGLLMLFQYFIPHGSFEFIYEYSIDFIIIIGIFALALGIWSLVRVCYVKIKRKAPGYFYSWVTLFGLVIMLFFGFFPFGIDALMMGNMGDSPHAVVVGDVDFDNDGDVIVANYESDNISIFKNKGAGQFISAYTFKAGKTPRALVMSDLDKDNDLDIIVANESTNQISVLLNNATPQDFKRKKLQITPDKKIDSLMNAGKPKFGKPMAYDVGTTPIAMACGDIDGDGDIDDVVVVNTGSNNVSVLIGNGDGTFKAAVNHNVGTEPAALYITDYNRDFNNDILVANKIGGVTMLMGDGRGGFEAAQTVPVENLNLTSLATGDFDQNGVIDLAVTGYSTDPDGNNVGQLVILQSDSLGFFVTTSSYDADPMPTSVYGSDLNGDGFRDLMVTGESNRRLMMYKNDGLGGFSETARVSTGANPIQCITADLNSAELPSLIAVNTGSNNVTTFTNKGNLEFKPEASLASGDILFLGGGLTNYFNRQLFFNIMIPIQATMFSLLAFYIASAAYRAFRARSVLATILLMAALIIMIRFVPLGPLSDGVSALSAWLLKVPNMAAKRAIFIGVGLGMVATAIKVILGIERTYMGRD